MSVLLDPNIQKEYKAAFDQIQNLRKWKPIGQTVTYLTKSLTVCGYSRSMGIQVTPGLQCRYLDNHGCIQDVFLTMQEVQPLMNEV